MDIKNYTLKFIKMFLVLCMFMGFFSVHVKAASIEEEGGEAKTFAPLSASDVQGANAAQVVLLVEFADTPRDEAGYDTAYPYGTVSTYFEHLVREMNGLGSDGSDSWIGLTFRNYLYTVSGGQHNVVSCFPQLYEDGTYLHLYSSLTARQYTENYEMRDATLIQDALEQLNAARPDLDVSLFDKNGDGCADNLLVIPLITGRDYDADTYASHAGSMPGASIGNSRGTKTIGHYTVVDGGVEVSEGSATWDSFDASVSIHEYLHTIGAVDLYRYSAGGKPVGSWDIMSAGSTWSWPLAITRKNLGWITDIPSVNLKNPEDSYRLYAPSINNASGSNGQQALIIRPSVSSTEYFVVEYRQRKPAGSAVSLGYDDHIDSSGLIIYRVNESLKDSGNKTGDDYVYIYRPDEEGLSDAKGDITKAALSAGSYTTQNGKTYHSSFGSLDLNDGITQGAICYSNGTNSGLRITALEQEADNITFKIEYEGGENIWSAVTSRDGLVPFTNIINPRASIVSDGSKLYVAAEKAWRPDSSASIYCYDGTDWSCIDAAANMKNINLVEAGGRIYAVGTDLNASSLIAKEYTSGTWKQTVALSGFTNIIEIPSVNIINGTIYAIVNDNYQSTGVYRVSGDSWEGAGSELSASLTCPTLIDLGDTVALVAGSTDASPWSTKLYLLSANDWTGSSRISEGAANAISAARLNGKTYVFANTNNTCRIYTFLENGTLESTNTLSSSIDASQGATLFATANNLYLGAASGDGGVRVYLLQNGNPNDPVQLGMTVYQGGSEIKLAAIGDTIYAAVPDNTTGTVAIRSHAMTAGDSAADPTDPVNPVDPAEPDNPSDPTNPNNPTIPIDPDNPKEPSDSTSADKTEVGISILDAIITLSSSSYVYDGKAKTPSLKVVCAGKTLAKGTDYTAAYSSNINAGTAMVTITGIGAYTGTLKKTFTISKASNKITASNITKTVAKTVRRIDIGAVAGARTALTYQSSYASVKVSSKGIVTIPKNFVGSSTITITGKETANYKTVTKKITVKVIPQSTSLVRLVNNKGRIIKITWKPGRAVTGYQIRYSAKKNFSTSKKITIKKNSIKTRTVRRSINKGKTYYVQIRTYKTVRGKKYYSKWSKASKIKVVR